MKKLSKKFKRLLLIIVIILIITFFLSFLFIFINTRPVSSNSDKKEIIIPSGSSLYDIANILKENDIIRNEKFFVYYLKLKKETNIYAAKYVLSSDMKLSEVVKTLSKGGTNPDEKVITFKEGITIRKVAEIISENTNNTYDEVMSVMTDKEYIKTLIDKYYFLDEIILSDDIYYPLEGYLYPETYSIKNKDITVQEIIEMMLNEEERVLSKYKKEINKSSMSIHEILTLASVVEQEGSTLEDRKTIAGVFFNRINDGIPLGSDVTAFYGAKIEVSDALNYNGNYNEKNKYNTRETGTVLVPIGPICNMSSSSIEAVLNPISSDYYYFVADKDKKVYFTKTYNEHIKMVDKLQSEGLWLE